MVTDIHRVALRYETLSQARNITGYTLTFVEDPYYMQLSIFSPEVRRVLSEFDISVPDYIVGASNEEAMAALTVMLADVDAAMASTRIKLSLMKSAERNDRVFQ